jgi:plastocyanin
MSRTRILIATLALATGIAAGIALRPGPSTAGPDRIAFPVNYRDGVLYTVADRYDVKQYRELFANREAVQAAREGKPLPNGSVLTLIQYKAQVDAQGNPLKDAQGRFLKGDLVGFAVMEKRQGWGAEYPEDIRNGDWEYSAFTADGKFNDKANFKACFQCHKPHDGQDFVISYPAMAGRTQVASTPPPPGVAGSVTIAGFVFAPGGITVDAGKPVLWTNTDDAPHQVTVVGTKLKTDFLLKGQHATLTFPDAGVFNYHCALHPNMKGSIEVKK